MFNIFSILTTAVSIYTLLCFLRIILSWFPGVSYSPFGRFLSAVCDPYLNIFRRLRFLRFSALDFSPAIAICFLYGISFFLVNFSRGSFPTIGSILAMILSLLWSVFSSLLGFLSILILIRLIVLLFSRGYGSYGSIWDQLDRGLSVIVYKITFIFSTGKTLPYKTALILALILLVIFQFGGRFLVEYLCYLLKTLPF